MKKLVILASGQGSTCEFLHKKFTENSGPWKIIGVLSDRPQAEVLTKAIKDKIPSVQCIGSDTRHTFDDNLLIALKELKPDLILLAGYLKLLSPAIIKEFPHKIINVHPSLLPKYSGKGMYGRKVHQAVYDAKESETGITIHYVNEKYDAGKIIKQIRWPIPRGVSVDIIEDNIKKLEKEALYDLLIKWLDETRHIRDIK